MSEEKKQYPNRRYVAKIKKMSGQYGEFQRVLVDNPNPENADGTPNPYYRGTLLWLDHTTGKKFLVKQLSVRGAPKASQEKGFIGSISIDLDDTYEVQELE